MGLDDCNADFDRILTNRFIAREEFSFTAMLRVMLDTNYWISLRYSPETRERFVDLASSDEVEVCFSYGNFIDLVQAEEQDELSQIIAEVVEVYIPAMDYEGDDYVYTKDPIGLIPDSDVAQFVRRETLNCSEQSTLQTIFRVGDWEPDTDWYARYTWELKDIYDEYGLEYAMAIAFQDYLEYGDEVARLWEHKIDVTEYVRKMASLYRIEAIQKNENIDSNDIADIEICSQAILTDCDMLLIESKWRNLELVNRVTDKLDSDEDVEVFDDIEEFLRVLEVYRSGESEP